MRIRLYIYSFVRTESQNQNISAFVKKVFNLQKKADREILSCSLENYYTRKVKWHGKGDIDSRICL
jgi:hypothetical protein